MEDHAIAIVVSSAVALLCITIIGLGLLEKHDKALAVCAAAMFVGLVAATSAAGDKAVREAKQSSSGSAEDSSNVYGTPKQDLYTIVACIAGAAILLAALHIYLAWRQATEGYDSQNVLRKDIVASLATWLATLAVLVVSAVVASA